MEIREYQKKDIPHLMRLWQDNFGDNMEFLEAYFSMLPDMGSCMVGIEDGQVVGMASALTGQELCYASSPKRLEAGYLYGIAVDKAFRGKGYGRDLTKAAVELAYRREAAMVYGCPANEGLFTFYEEFLDVKALLRRTKYEVPAADEEQVMRLNATEYNMMREGILTGKDFLRISYFAADFLRINCEVYGGGLYAAMSGICTAQKVDDCCVIYEMLSQNPKATAASVAKEIGCTRAVYYLPSEDGEPYLIMIDKDLVPAGTIWNIAYE